MLSHLLLRLRSWPALVMQLVGGWPDGPRICLYLPHILYLVAKLFEQCSSLLVIYWCYPSLTLLSSTLSGPIWWSRWYISFARHIFPTIIASYHQIADRPEHYIAPNLRTDEFLHSPLLHIQPSIPSILPTLHRRATWQMAPYWLCTPSDMANATEWAVHSSDMGITVEMAVDGHYKSNLPLVRWILMLTLC